jgi:chromosome segregation ATPase
MNTNVDLIPFLTRQQIQLDNIDKRLEQLTDVLTRIALLEERRAHDRQAVERVEQDLAAHKARTEIEINALKARFELELAAIKSKSELELKSFKDKCEAEKKELDKKTPAYDEMLSSYNIFKKAIIGMIVTAMVGGIVWFSAQSTSLRLPTAPANPAVSATTTTGK